MLLVTGLAWLAVASFVIPAPSAGAAASGPPRVDSDRDKVFDDLETHLGQGSPADELSVIVTLRDRATTDRIETLRATAGTLDVTHRFSIIDGFAARVPRGKVRALAARGIVERVERNATVRVANDAAQSAFGVTRARLDVPSLEGNADGNVATYSANDLVVAVIDSGIHAAHRDLDEGKVIGFRDFVNGQTTPYDDDGHGTHVSGTIAGEGDARADLLYRGVAPGAALVGVKVIDGNGNGSEADVIAGIDWTVANKSTYGIEVDNISLGLLGCGTDEVAISQAVNNASDAGLVMVVAAGNEGPETCTIRSPGAAAKALTVGAMADFGSNGFYQADFSSRGPTGDNPPQIKPDVSAPGVAINSARFGTTAGYVSFDGTSMAAPFTAGVAALMLDANASLTPQQVKDKIMQTAIDWGRGGNSGTLGSRGKDTEYGAGRLDVYAALQSAGAGLNVPPGVPVHQLREGTLSGMGDQDDYQIQVTDTDFPIAATLILPGALDRDFDLRLFGPGGNEVDSALGTQRQDQLGYKPTVTGTYTLRVVSYSGNGDYFVDISAGRGPSYPHPTGGATFRVPLVPAFGECTQAQSNSVHGGNLASDDSCSNPPLRSSTVTIGNSLALGTRLGFASVDVCVAPQPATGACSASALGGPVPDVRLRGNGSDVVCQALSPACPGGAGSDYDPNTSSGPYTSNLDSGTDSNAQIPQPTCNPSPPNPSSCAAGADMTASAVIPGSTSSAGRTMRITDRFNSLASVTDPSGCGSTSSCSATVRDQAFAAPVVCRATTSGSVGSYCGTNTTANALVPGVVVAGKSAVVQLGQFQVLDSGPDGIRANGDDQVFAVQGIYVP